MEFISTDATSAIEYYIDPGSTGRRVTFSDTILYMIADNATLTSLRSHHCKKHTASFACSTGNIS